MLTCRLTHTVNWRFGDRDCNPGQGLIVVAPIEDTPAFRAGIKSGDKIIRINDLPTDTLEVMNAVRLMRGPKGKPCHWWSSAKGNPSF